jgi:hypothetical protein
MRDLRVGPVPHLVAELAGDTFWHSGQSPDGALGKVATNFQQNYPPDLSAFLGVTPARIIRAERLNLGPEQRHHARRCT